MLVSAMRINVCMNVRMHECFKNLLSPDKNNEIFWHYNHVLNINAFENQVKIRYPPPLPAQSELFATFLVASSK